MSAAVQDKDIIAIREHACRTAFAGTTDSLVCKKCGAPGIESWKRGVYRVRCSLCSLDVSTKFSATPVASYSPAQPRNTAPQSVAGSDGAVLAEQAPRPSLPGGDHSAAPIIHYSCGCNRVKRATASADTCTECHKPLSIRYDNNRPVDPNIHVGIIGKMIADQLVRLRAIIDESRPHLALADVSSALRVIDEARGMIKLHDLGNPPLVMPRDYGVAPVFNRSASPAPQASSLKTQASRTPEGT